jgi:hypothetical protein
MSNGDARLFNLLLRQPRCETDLQGGLGGEDLVFGARGIGSEGFVTGDEDALGQTLNKHRLLAMEGKRFRG